MNMLSILLNPSPNSTEKRMGLEPISPSKIFLKNKESPTIDTRNKDDTNGRKRYLQGEKAFMQHTIWRQQGFWDTALLEGTIGLLEQSDSAHMSWDELPFDQLREKVIGVHNIVFGQLGSLAFAMHQSGLDFAEVESNVFAMCQRCQLTEDQRFDLINSVRVMFGGISTPAMQSPSSTSSRLSPGGALYHHSQSPSGEDVDQNVELEYATVIRPLLSTSDTGTIDDKSIVDIEGYQDNEHLKPFEVVENHMDLNNVIDTIASINNEGNMDKHTISSNTANITISSNVVEEVLSTSSSIENPPVSSEESANNESIQINNHKQKSSSMSYFLFHSMSSATSKNSSTTKTAASVVVSNNILNSDGNVIAINNKTKMPISAVQLMDSPSKKLPKSIEFNDDDFAIL